MHLDLSFVENLIGLLCENSQSSVDFPFLLAAGGSVAYQIFPLG